MQDYNSTESIVAKSFGHFHNENISFRPFYIWTFDDRCTSSRSSPKLINNLEQEAKVDLHFAG